MENSISSRFKRAWNAFANNRDPTQSTWAPEGGYYYRPDRPRLSRGKERSIVTALINRIALDVAANTFQHCRLDEEGRFKEVVDSKLNRCLNLEANLDQTGRAFIHDLVVSMCDEGVVAIFPTDTLGDPRFTDSYDIFSMRTAKITQWFPNRVKIYAYDERDGRKKDVSVLKKTVGIIENPLFAVMNEPNSTMQRLIRKLNLLDAIDEQSGSGKLDLIIQLPYVIKSDARRQQAEQRRKDIEMQLSGSKFGIAYTDGSERITQLNRPVENNLMKQVEYLTSMLYSQLGFAQSILDGTADERTMRNYYDRTIEPISSAIADEMNRKFLSQTARTQGQSIKFFRDPFRLVPVNELANIADKFTRNEILSKNEVRQIIGRKPSSDPKADKLINSNISQPAEEVGKQSSEPNEEIEEGGKNQNGEI